jgi:hypothetical protein
LAPPGEGVGKLVRVLVEALGNRRIDGVHAQGHVAGQHHRRVLLGRIVRIRDGGH